MPPSSVILNLDTSKPHIRYRGERVLNLYRRLTQLQRGNESKQLAAEIFYSFYLPYPILSEEPPSHDDEEFIFRYNVIKAMLQSERYLEVKKFTTVDVTTSMVASAVFMYNLMRELGRRRQGRGRSGGGASARSGQARGAADELRDAVERSLESIKKTVENAKKISQFVAGMGAGTGSAFSMENLAYHVLKLAENTHVELLLNYLSTIEDAAAKVTRRTTVSVRGEISGYTLGSHLERVVPHEFSYPRIMFYVKLVESQLLLYEKRLPEDVGAIYVLLDKSGSMVGRKILWAKAVALALAKRAIAERRPFVARFFDSIPHPPIVIKPKMKSGDAIKLLEYMARVSAVGGTDITRALIAATEDIRSRILRGLSDIVLITDGEDRIAVEVVRRHLSRSRSNLLTVMIQGSNPDLKNLSSKYFLVAALDKDEALRVIQG